MCELTTVHARDMVRAGEAYPERHQCSSATVAYLMDKSLFHLLA